MRASLENFKSLNVQLKQLKIDLEFILKAFLFPVVLAKYPC